MDIILIPGLWLDGSSWDAVVAPLEWAGHRPHAVTLPGLESPDSDRSGITLRDHVEAVVAIIDSIEDGEILLVGHSAGCAIAYAAVDARPDRIARVVYVGGFPTADGVAIASDFPADGDDVVMPEWSDFDESDLQGLDSDALTRFAERAVPSPAGVTNGVQHLVDERRRSVPATAVCPEYRSDDLKSWIAADATPVREFASLTDLTYVDLPTGHWPQFSRPFDLARLLDSCSRHRGGTRVVIDSEGRIEPPEDGDETETLLGFLDFQRATFDWKCIGPDADGMRATVGDSRMTLGGLVKHIAWVEDHWFSQSLHGNGAAEVWADVDWQADHDWEWNSAANDTPGELAAMWHASVRRSRELTAAAIAEGGLGMRAKRSDDSPNLRWILTHMVEEYARHNGHADLIRETVDGVTGE